MFLSLGVLAGVAAPPTFADLILGIVVLAALALTVSAARSLSGSVGWRLVAVGAVLIGFAPVISEVHWAIVADPGPLTFGDAVLVCGYGLLLAGLRRVLTARTVAVQLRAVFDATLATLWIAYITLRLVVPELSEQLAGLELLAAMLYLPLSLAIVFLLLQLVLGSHNRSASVWFLASTAALTVASELGFLAVAAGQAELRRYAVGAAALALVMIAAGIRHPTAPEIERPVAGLERPMTVARSSYLILSLLAITVALVAEPRPDAYAIVILAAIIVTTCANLYLIMRAREYVIEREQQLRHAVAEIMRAENPTSILTLGGKAVDDLLSDKRHLEADFVARDAGPWHVVPGDEAATFANDAEQARLEAAVDDGTIARDEAPSELPGVGFVTRLAVPLSDRSTHADALVIESSPVLSTMEIDQLRQVAASVDQTLVGYDLHELTHKQRADRRFRALVQDANDVVCLIDPETHEIEMVSPSVHRILGYDEASLVGSHILDFTQSEDSGTVASLVQECLRKPQASPVDVRLRHADDHFHWFSLMARYQTGDHEISGVVLSFTDVQDRKMAELSLGFSEQRYRTMVLNSKDVFALLERDLTINYVSPNVERVLGYPAADLIASKVTSLLTETSRYEIDQFMKNARGELRGDVVELEIKTQSGQVRVAEVTISHREDGQGDGYTVTMSDVTERLALEQSLREQALYDPLTGLANRPTLHAEVQHRLQRLTVNDFLGVIHLDIVDFKSVNDSVGFEAGDDLLVEVATRLRTSLRSTDTLARIGGNEFVIVTVGESADEIMGFAKRVSTLFNRTFVVASRQHRLAVAAGVEITSDRSVVAGRTLENASLAVTEARRQQPEMVKLYDPVMREVAIERFELSADLASALERGELSVVYQPILELETRRVREVEALLRWNHPERGPISPGVFIPLAEKSGLIVELGRWVMQAATEQLRKWEHEIDGASHLGVSVNVSALQLEQAHEADELGGIVAASGVNPDRVTVELTESTFLDDPAWINGQLQTLVDCGMRVAVDDFGTGAAGLGHLRDIPFNVVKIDKSFIDTLADAGGEAEQLVRGVIDLAHRLGAETVAEGIETPKEFEVLDVLGCDLGQGFYLGRPMEPGQLAEWFDKGRSGSVPSLIHRRD